jgi:hypothetical protein
MTCLRQRMLEEPERRHSLDHTRWLHSPQRFFLPRAVLAGASSWLP